MRKRPFGATGESVAIVGQGTWMLERAARRDAVAALRRGLDAGLSHVDTAEMYGSGRVEEIVAEAIEGRRDEVFLASKVLPANASYEGTRRACEASLRRLRTTHLDLYLLHWPSRHPFAETARAFARLREQGKVRFAGVSNFDADDLAAAVATAGAGEIACNQVLYHLEERAIEHAVWPACERLDVALVGYSPLGGGRMVSPRSRGGRVLAEIAAARGVGAAEVALAFLVRAAPLFTIPKAVQPAHVDAAARAGDLVLDDAEIARLDAAFPRGRKRALPTA